MRFQRTAAVVGAALLFWALGPGVLLLVLVALSVGRVRRCLRPTWRTVAAGAVVLAVLAGLVVLVPDGWLPIPPGPGALVTPSYLGRPVVARPLDLEVPQHPGLAPERGSGPLGESPEVDTAFYGLEHCATLAFESRGRLVAACGGSEDPRLHVLDPDSMRPLATKELPASPGSRCATPPLYLDADDRAVLATDGRRILVVATSDADGEPDLTTEASHDLSGSVPAEDCLVALAPDWTGRIWYATRAGLVGFVAPGSGDVTVLDLGEEVTESWAVDEDGVYVVTPEALHRLGVDRAGKPTVTWRTPYDRGGRSKPGQSSQGSGTAPTLLPGGLVAISDNAHPRMHVVFHRADNGRMVCQEAVFTDEASATDSSLASVGAGVVVANGYGYTGAWRTALGRTTPGGLARIDVVDGECEPVWSSEVAAPSSGPAVSPTTGLVHSWVKRKSWAGANAWYLTAVDATTGRTAYSVRAGLGMLLDNHHAPVTLAPDGSAYVATLGGLVRVRDRD